MLGHHRRGSGLTAGISWGGCRGRPRRGRRLWLLDGLEDRLLLSGNPTIYTVNSTDGGSSGSGDSGTLPYVIALADADPNPAGPADRVRPDVVFLAANDHAGELAGTVRDGRA